MESHDADEEPQRITFSLMDVKRETKTGAS